MSKQQQGTSLEIAGQDTPKAELPAREVSFAISDVGADTLVQAGDATLERQGSKKSFGGSRAATPVPSRQGSRQTYSRHSSTIEGSTQQGAQSPQRRFRSMRFSSPSPPPAQAPAGGLLRELSGSAVSNVGRCSPSKAEGRKSVGYPAAGVVRSVSGLPPRSSGGPSVSLAPLLASPILGNRGIVAPPPTRSPMVMMRTLR